MWVSGLEIPDVARRDSFVEVLAGPQLDLSKRIRAICEGKNREGIVGKLWPNVGYMKCVCSSSKCSLFEFLPFGMYEMGVVAQESVGFSGGEVGKLYKAVVSLYHVEATIDPFFSLYLLCLEFFFQNLCESNIP